MFEFFAIASAILGFVGGMQQRSSLKKSAKAQAAAAEKSKRIANRNAARIEAETAEEVRRKKLENESRQSLTKARQAASGGLPTGSNAIFMETMEREDDLAVDWLKKSGSSRAGIAREEGEYSYMTGMAQSQATKGQAQAAGFDALGSLVSGGESIYKLWG